MLSSHLLPAGLHPLLLKGAVGVLAGAVHQALAFRGGDQADQGVLARDGARRGGSLHQGSTRFSILSKFLLVFLSFLGTLHNAVGVD